MNEFVKPAEPKPVRRMLQPSKQALREEIASLINQSASFHTELLRVFAENVKLREELKHPLRLWWRRVMRRA